VYTVIPALRRWRQMAKFAVNLGYIWGPDLHPTPTLQKRVKR
jgi:hypothetical protein